MRNIKLLLEYDGTDFSGWQSQAQGERTVQDVLAGAVSTVTGEDASVVAAGRTDSGVHALGQAVCFSTDSTLDGSTIKRAINANLPPDVRVLEAEEVPEDFHPIRDTRGKVYVYLIGNMDIISPFVSRYVWHHPIPLDTEAMAEAAVHFKGRHDFASFMAAGSDVKATVREVFGISCLVSDEERFLGFSLRGNFIRLEVEGEGFLRHMVRNIAGTLVEVGRGKISADDVPGIIAACSRDAAGPTAPAQGLFLKEVRF